MHLLHYLYFFMLVHENTVVQCLFMLVHSALTNDFNNALVNAEINFN